MEKVIIKLIGINIQKMMNIGNKQIIIFIKLNTLLKQRLLIKLEMTILKLQEIMERN